MKKINLKFLVEEKGIDLISARPNITKIDDIYDGDNFIKRKQLNEIRS